jgi:succinoglycan biosynthesis transport protein ExoP
MRQRESELRGALAAQKVKVLELNRARDEFGVLLKDMDSAQRAFDAASQRLSQTKIEASSEQSDISILNPAVEPVEPSGPRVLLNTLVSVMLGTVLGVGTSLLIEMLNRPIRSAGDLKELLGVPVLGTVEWRQPRARTRGLRALMAPRRLRLN